MTRATLALRQVLRRRISLPTLVDRNEEGLVIVDAGLVLRVGVVAIAAAATTWYSAVALIDWAIPL